MTLNPRIVKSRVHLVRAKILTYQIARSIATDSRQRLSKFWIPTGGLSPQEGEHDESHALLVRGGFLRQAHSGVFHFLPLGLRVQNKLEALIDKHMSSIGASKLSLSSLTTETLWRQSGRYSTTSELLRIKDRRESGFLLSPTHEEEITALVAGMVHSYKDLPLRLYQVGRKYRDERRPRQGLLRAKEFMMKDLYTFDHSHEAALQTYGDVRRAYDNLFQEFKLPYLVADADSGNMGGKLSHEYHFVSPKGEDQVWSCNECTYVANEELVEKRAEEVDPASPTEKMVFTGISVDRKTAIEIHIPRPSSFSSNESQTWISIASFVNLHALKRALPPKVDIDTGIEPHTLAELLPHTTSRLIILDRTFQPSSTGTSPPSDLTPITPSSPCPRCPTGQLHSQPAIEIAHTFHLGTRYSVPLNALVVTPANPANEKQPIQMGCHGIGVSRLIGAIAALCARGGGLSWPRVIAPFEVAVLFNTGRGEGSMNGTKGRGDEDGKMVYDLLREREDVKIDVVLDDRPAKSLGWKLRDADLIGYPVVIVLGRGWKERREVEVQCQRLGVKRDIRVEELRGSVEGLLEKL